MSEQMKMDAERAAFQAYLLDCREHDLEPDTASAFRFAYARASLPVRVPDGLLTRIDSAIKAFTSGRASMHVPPDPDDVDMVLGECWKLVNALIAAPTVKAEQPECGCCGRPDRCDDDCDTRQAPSLPAAGSADQPYEEGIAEDLERSDWAPLEALQWYAAGKHFDAVGGRTRIIDTGAVASNALKHASLDYLELKGDAELSELRDALSAQQSAPERVSIPIPVDLLRDALAEMEMEEVFTTKRGEALTAIGAIFASHGRGEA